MIRERHQTSNNPTNETIIRRVFHLLRFCYAFPMFLSYKYAQRIKHIHIRTTKIFIPVASNDLRANSMRWLLIFSIIRILSSCQLRNPGAIANIFFVFFLYFVVYLDIVVCYECLSVYYLISMWIARHINHCLAASFQMAPISQPFHSCQYWYRAYSACVFCCCCCCDNQ